MADWGRGWVAKRAQISGELLMTLLCFSCLKVGVPARESLYRRMVSEARGDLFVKTTCLENSHQSLTLFLTE